MSGTKSHAPPVVSQAMTVVDCRVESASFRMIVSNERERQRIDTLLTKEPETLRWIAEHFRAGDTLFDIGANVGIFAIYAAALNPRGIVVAVEPMAASFHRLCENGRLNDLRNLRPYCVAVSAHDGVGTMHLSSLDAASSMHALGDTDVFGETVVMETGVGLATLDTLAAAAGKPSLLMIDVDGGEDDVLAGAAAVLRDPALRSVLIEFNWRDEQNRRRDEPLLRAGFALTGEGAECTRAGVRWQNSIYVR